MTIVVLYKHPLFKPILSLASEILVTGQVPISLPKMDTVSAFLWQFTSPFPYTDFTQFSQQSCEAGKTGFIPILLKGKLKPKEIM